MRHAGHRQVQQVPPRAPAQGVPCSAGGRRWATKGLGVSTAGHRVPPPGRPWQASQEQRSSPSQQDRTPPTSTIVARRPRPSASVAQYRTNPTGARRELIELFEQRRVSRATFCLTGDYRF
jgi:hypothetical protein